MLAADRAVLDECGYVIYFAIFSLSLDLNGMRGDKDFNFVYHLGNMVLL